LIRGTRFSFIQKKQNVKKLRKNEKITIWQSCLVGGTEATLTKKLFSLSFFSPPQAHASSVGLRRLELNVPQRRLCASFVFIYFDNTGLPDQKTR
tara:strand:- start:10943 stop:11227 length:285 start_codon:yes stop_codon:yes gene_type:complete